MYTYIYIYIDMDPLGSKPLDPGFRRPLPDERRGRKALQRPRRGPRRPGFSFVDVNVSSGA